MIAADLQRGTFSTSSSWLWRWWWYFKQFLSVCYVLTSLSAPFLNLMLLTPFHRISQLNPRKKHKVDLSTGLWDSKSCVVSTTPCCFQTILPSQRKLSSISELSPLLSEVHLMTEVILWSPLTRGCLSLVIIPWELAITLTSITEAQNVKIPYE